MGGKSLNRPSAAVILGAGFSYIAGLPLTRDLFAPASEKPESRSKLSAQKHEDVRLAFNRALSQEPGLSAEQWLARLYSDRENVFQPMITGTRWEDAIRYAL